MAPRTASPTKGVGPSLLPPVDPGSTRPSRARIATERAVPILVRREVDDPGVPSSPIDTTGLSRADKAKRTREKTRLCKAQAEAQVAKPLSRGAPSNAPQSRAENPAQDIPDASTKRKVSKSRSKPAPKTPTEAQVANPLSRGAPSSVPLSRATEKSAPTVSDTPVQDKMAKRKPAPRARFNGKSAGLPLPAAAPQAPIPPPTPTSSASKPPNTISSQPPQGRRKGANNASQSAALADKAASAGTKQLPKPVDRPEPSSLGDAVPTPRPWTAILTELRAAVSQLPPWVAEATAADTIANLGSDPVTWELCEAAKLEMGQASEFETLGEHFNDLMHKVFGWESDVASTALGLVPHIRRGTLGVLGVCRFLEYFLDAGKMEWATIQPKLESLLHATRSQ